MQQNRVRELWKQGKPAVQGWCSTDNPYIAEMMGHAGFDAVVIDWQHGVGVSQESIVACIQAIGSSEAVPIVRLPRNSPEYISYVLDAGPAVSAKFVKMGSMLCQIGNEMRMLTAATAEAIKTFREAMS